MGKQVYASMYKPFATSSDSVLKALDLLIARGGVMRVAERWVFDALQPFADSGYVSFDRDWVSFADDFEGLLLDLASFNPAASPLLVSYRALMRDKQQVYTDTDNFVAAKIADTVSVIGKLEVISAIISDLSKKLSDICERVPTLESQMYEIDTALAIVESVLNNEASNS